jgi:hypothetical protein
MEEKHDRDFDSEEELLSFVEMRVRQLNSELDDLERVQASEQPEEFEKHRQKIEKGTMRLREIIQANYIKFAGGEGKIENWEEIGMYSSTTTLLERLTEIADTGTGGV